MLCAYGGLRLYCLLFYTNGYCVNISILLLTIHNDSVAGSLAAAAAGALTPCVNLAGL